jgi:cobalt/nickel transport protein
MTRRVAFITAVLFILCSPGAHAHFGMIIPSDDIVSQGDANRVSLKLAFAHPFEMQGMSLEKPQSFWVMTGREKADLTGTLRQIKFLKERAWESSYTFKRPGVYSFAMEPRPYWEPAEDSYIIHYTKVIMSAFGLEDGWDAEMGLKTEIVPLTRPFGLYAGNVFQGVVKLDGKAVPNCDVEVELYNEKNRFKAPADSFITQVVRTDANGVFTYAAPKAGWWGFAALNASDRKIDEKDVELGAVLWVRFHDMQ